MEKKTRTEKYKELRDTNISNESRNDFSSVQNKDNKTRLTRTEKYADLRKGKKSRLTKTKKNEEKNESPVKLTRSSKYSDLRKSFSSKPGIFTNKKSAKKLIIISAICIVCLCIGIGIFHIVKNKEPINEYDQLVDVQPEILNDLFGDGEKGDKFDEYHDTWLNNSIYNSDYIGQIIFESEIINEPIVQSFDNDYYLRKDFRSMEGSDFGTVFMDFACEENSQNIVLYGHNVFSTYNNGIAVTKEQQMFTPLKELTSVENYEENSVVYLVLQTEIRKYKVVSVYYCELKDEDGQLYPEESLYYYTPDFTAEYFETYKKAVLERQFYDTGVSFSNADKFLTLQTCIEGNGEEREIVLCKQIDTYKYTDSQKTNNESTEN